MIVTLHGWSFNREIWEETPFKRAIHLELPGHGESVFKSTNVSQLAEELFHYIPPKSTLVGWSLGASVLTVFAEKFPERVKELILLAPTLRFSGLSQHPTVVKRFLKKLKRDFQKGVWEFRNICSKNRFPVPKLNEEKAVRILEDFCRLDLRKRAEKVDVPVRIYVGQNDEVTGVNGALQLFLKFKKAELTVHPEADHLTILWKSFF